MIHPAFPKLSRALLAVLALGALVAVAGCGRRGPLEPPPAGAPDSLASAPAQGQAPGQIAGQTAAVTTPPAPGAGDAGAGALPAPSLDAAKTEAPGLPQQSASRPAGVTPVRNSFFLDSLLN